MRFKLKLFMLFKLTFCLIFFFNKEEGKIRWGVIFSDGALKIVLMKEML